MAGDEAALALEPRRLSTRAEADGPRPRLDALGRLWVLTRALPESRAVCALPRERDVADDPRRGCGADRVARPLLLDFDPRGAAARAPLVRLAREGVEDREPLRDADEEPDFPDPLRLALLDRPRDDDLAFDPLRVLPRDDVAFRRDEEGRDRLLLAEDDFVLPRLLEGRPFPKASLVPNVSKTAETTAMVHRATQVLLIATLLRSTACEIATPVNSTHLLNITPHG